MKASKPTPQEVMPAVPREFREWLEPKSWFNVSRSLLGWALCTLRMAVREANAFFQIYKHAREDNNNLRRILAEHNIEVPPYDWRRDENLITQSHKAIPLGIWGWDIDQDLEEEPMLLGCSLDDFDGAFTMTVRTPKQLAAAVEQTRMLDSTLDKIRDEFYSRDIQEGGWSVDHPGKVRRLYDF